MADRPKGQVPSQTRKVLDRLLRDGTAVARLDGTLHTLFPVAVNASEGEALRQWVMREGASRTIEIGLGYGSVKPLRLGLERPARRPGGPYFQVRLRLGVELTGQLSNPTPNLLTLLNVMG